MRSVSEWSAVREGHDWFHDGVTTTPVPAFVRLRSPSAGGPRTSAQLNTSATRLSLRFRRSFTKDGITLLARFSLVWKEFDQKYVMW